ncbi:MAG: D-alanyl-D-alanine carboxypeptidase family protein [Myxococcota bacterium]
MTLPQTFPTAQRGLRAVLQLAGHALVAVLMVSAAKAGVVSANSTVATAVWQQTVQHASAPHTGLNCSGTIQDGYAPAPPPAVCYEPEPPQDVCLVSVDGVMMEIETANAFAAMRDAALNSMGANWFVPSFVPGSGFRSHASQQKLRWCWECKSGGTPCSECTYVTGSVSIPCGTSCNKAACPGFSKHQAGLAVDIQGLSALCPQFANSPTAIAQGVADCLEVSTTFKWLMENAEDYGFARTVSVESWHWQYVGGGPSGPCTASACGADEGGVPTAPVTPLQAPVPDVVFTQDGPMDTDSQYLAGVVRNEMGWVPVNWFSQGSQARRHEALRAQAIAARTFLMKRLLAQGLDTELPNSTYFQTYSTAPQPSDVAAAESTSNLVLSWGDDLTSGQYASGAWPLDQVGMPLPPSTYGIDQHGAAPELTWEEARELHSAGQLTDKGDGFSWTWVYITLNAGKSGGQITQAPKPFANPVASNRGALGQYRALWLAHQQGLGTDELLHHFYGEDIGIAKGILSGEGTPAPPTQSPPSQSTEPLSPNNDAVVPDGAVALSWQPVQGATNYQIGIWYVGSDGELAWYTTLTLGDVQTYSFTPEPGAGAFRFKVRGLSDSGSGAWSSWATFQFDWWCQDGGPPGSCDCEPDCSGRECGPNGCGGICGDCSLIYTPQFGCVDGGCECQPLCSGKECGADGCGGSCGDCSLLYTPQFGCFDGVCDCQPLCSGKECGPDGCGGSCGDCSLLYNPQFGCAGGVCDCQPLCSGKECGPDGCAGSCGTCAGNEVCQGTQCVCVPQCSGKECGPDGCGGSCGDCSLLYNPQFGCFGGVCDCQPLCSGKECGADGCGGSCGTCANAGTCQFGSCSCSKVCLDGDTLLNSDCTTTQCGVGQSCQVVGPPGGGGTSTCQ